MNDHDGSDLTDGPQRLLQDAVRIEVEMEGHDTSSLKVQEVVLTEGTNQANSCSLRVRCQARLEPRELLRKDCRVRVSRAEHTRAFRGIVRHARIREANDEFELSLSVVPAFFLLSQVVTSRVHQNTTVPDLVSALVDELLGASERTVRDETTASYQEHEYLIQHRESYYAFLNRLCEEEGIFWFFDHEGEHEVLVLADSTTGLSDARSNKEAVRFVPGLQGEEEAVTSVDYDERVGPTDVVLRGYDWTRAATMLSSERTDRGASDPVLEVYEHTDAFTVHEYDGTAYTADTADTQAQRKAEGLDLDRQDWNMQSTFVEARPGTLFELTGFGDEELNTRYLIVGSTHRGSIGPSGLGTYVGTIRSVPTSVPYRPPRRTPAPRISGIESATVVTDGREIMTDVHGRVKVQFHWDRLGNRDEHSSCWIRVMQNWAGNGFGTFLLPRRGMEVIVSFIGGNPDRPVITGCLYNSENRPPVQLEDRRTQSVIRTRSSENSQGFNELRFEDQAGSEFVSLHAQRNLLEKVLNDRTTDIENDDTLTVTRDQTTHIKREEHRDVDHNATWKYRGTWERSINSLVTRIGGVDNPDGAPGDRYSNSAYRHSTFGGGEGVKWEDYASQKGQDTEFKQGTNRNVRMKGGGRFIVHKEEDDTTQIQLDSGSDHVDIGAINQIRIGVGGSGCASDTALKLGSGKVALGAESSLKIELAGGPSIEITPASIKLTNAASTLEVLASGVKINGSILDVNAALVTRHNGPFWD